jgi:hypothetical protein
VLSLGTGVHASDSPRTRLKLTEARFFPWPMTDSEKYSRYTHNSQLERFAHYQSTHWQVFRKFSYSLGPDVSELIEEILDHHEIADQDIESSLEALVVEYSKQDGKSLDVLLHLIFSQFL